MTNPTPKPTVARLTTPAQMVASLPLYLGYTPTESFVVACLHEPRGRVGLTMRFDLPAPEHEDALVQEALRRVRLADPSRLLVVVYTGADDEGQTYAREELVEDFLAELADELAITEAVLVRGGRFWSYLCRNARCCPPQGTPVDAAQGDDQVQLLQAEQVLRGRVVLADRDELEQSLAGPTFLAAEQARQLFEGVAADLADGWGDDDAREELLEEWGRVVEAFAGNPESLTAGQTARLALSLEDRLLRDSVACSHAPEALLPLLAELCRRTPEPYDAPVVTLFAWMAYCEGAGAEVTIALDRAQSSDPRYSMASLLRGLLDQQVSPEELRRVTREVAQELPAARRRARRSRRSRGSAS